MGRANGPFSTDRAEDAARHLGGFFAPHQVRAAGALGFVHASAALGSVSLHRIGYGAEVTIELAAPLDFYLFQLTLTGVTSLRLGGREVVTGPGEFTVINAGEPFEKRWSRAAEQLMLRVDRRVMEAAAGGASLRFDPAARPAERLPLLAAMMRAAGDGPPVLRQPPMGQRFGETLLQILLHELPHGRGLRSPAAPRGVLRAEAFIEAHAREEISLSDMVRAAGVSRRALHAAFRRFRDSTPGAYLREVRLARARALLLAGAAVTGAAEEAGLRHLGRFAHDYSSRYGERPSETRRRALGGQSGAKPALQPG